jgi:preprotein translocase subunit SecA
VVLSVLDRKWREHLYEMDYLREGIGLRAYSQRDPLVEYQREGFDMFATMMDGIKEESVGFLFNLEVQVDADDESAAVPVPGGDLAGPADDDDADRRPLLDSSAPASGATPVGERHPQIHAKGLSTVTVPRELTYAAPTADGDAGVDVHRERVEDADGTPADGAPATDGRVPRQGNTPRRNAPRQGTKRSKNKKKRR